MRGLRFFLFVSFVYSALITLIYVFVPDRAAEVGLGPLDPVTQRYVAAMFLALTVANWYAYRDPAKNVAIVVSLIVLYAATAVVALYDALTGAEEWAPALVSLVSGMVLAVGLGWFYQRGRGRPSGSPRGNPKAVGFRAQP